MAKDKKIVYILKLRCESLVHKDTTQQEGLVDWPENI